jgi:hypothetical protein
VSTWVLIAIIWSAASILLAVLWVAIKRVRRERDELLDEYYFELRERDVPAELHVRVAQELRRRDDERRERLASRDAPR